MITMESSQLMAKLAGVHDIGTVTPQEGEWPSADKPEAWRCRGCIHWAQAASSSCSVCGTTRDGWPKRDAVPFVREVPITPEMVAAGMAALRTPCRPDYELVEATYRAMHAAAPIELLSAGELAALRERDGLQREVADLRTRLAERDVSALKAIRNRV